MFTPLGGIDDSSQDVLGAASFSVNTASAVPEPATLTLTGASTLLPITKKLRKRSRNYAS